MYLQSIKSVKQNAAKSLTGQLKEKPTYRVRGSSIPGRKAGIMFAELQSITTEL